MLYQTLVGIWPLEALDDEGRQALRERIENYLRKAVREAKQHSSWLNPCARRRKLLPEIIELAAPGDILAQRVRALLHSSEDGRPKLYLIWRTLRQRREHPELVRDGDYLALESGGSRSEHLCAFARYHDDQCLLTIAPRWYTTLLNGKSSLPLGRNVWEDTWVQAPDPHYGGRYENVLSGKVVKVRQGDAGLHFAVAELLAHFPVALLRSRRESH